MSREGEGGARACCVAALPPTIYRGPGGAPATLEIPSEGGGWRPRGGLPPKASGAPPHPRVSNPRRTGKAHGGRPSPLRAGSLPTSAMGPSGIGGPTRWTPGTLPVDPRDPSGGPGTIPITPETFPVAETGLPIYNYSPPDHSGTPRDVRDLIRDSEQLSGFRILISLQP